MFEVVPIIVPKVDWAALADLAQSTLGRSITTIGDRASLKSNSPAAQVVALESFSTGDGKSAREMLENAWATTLGHLHYGFWISAEPQAIIHFVKVCAGILCISGKNEILVSGNLWQWREALRATLNTKADVWARMIATEIHNRFVVFGLESLFGVKRTIGDGTALLE